MPSIQPQDIIDKIDDTIYALVEDGASSKSFMGRSYSVMDVDKLFMLRERYAKLQESLTPTTNTNPICSTANFSKDYWDTF